MFEYLYIYGKYIETNLTFLAFLGHSSYVRSAQKPLLCKKEVDFRHFGHNPRNKIPIVSKKTYTFRPGSFLPKHTGLTANKSPCYAALLPSPLFAIVKSYYFTKPP